MSIEQKPPEVLQAQVAGFMAAELEVQSAQQHVKRAVYDRVGELAAGELIDATVSVRDNFGNDSTHTLHVDDYKAHIRRTHGSSNAYVQERIPFLKAYKDYEPDIAKLATNSQVSISQLFRSEAAIQTGNRVHALPFSHDGKAYIAKSARYMGYGALETEQRVINLAAGKGIEHLEQLAAFSYEDGIAVMERLPGVDLLNIETGDIEKITEAQLVDALHTIRAAHDAGIDFDGAPGNYIYDHRAGFGFIDYEPHWEGFTKQSYSYKVEDFIGALSQAGSAWTQHRANENREKRANRYAACTVVLTKMQSAFQSQTNVEQHRRALSLVSEYIHNYRVELESL